MGKARRHKIERSKAAPENNASDPAQALYEAMRTMDRAAADVRRAAAAAGARYKVNFEQDAITGSIAGHSDTVSETIALFSEVISIIHNGRPVSPDGVKGYRWVPPLTPEKLLLYADVAKVTDPTYFEGAQQNDAFERAREAEITAASERRCEAPGGCRVRAVYLPVDTAAHHCWRHIASDENHRAELIYDSSVADIDCPGCFSRAGTACDEEDTRRANGRWPRIRNFHGRAVHKERLDLWQRGVGSPAPIERPLTPAV